MTSKEYLVFHNFRSHEMFVPQWAKDGSPELFGTYSTKEEAETHIRKGMDDYIVEQEEGVGIMTEDNSTKTYDFTYDGKKRHVVDATYEPEHNTIVGLEETKGRKNTNQVKRYNVDKMSELKEDNEKA
jgi:hypothetical protein